MQILLGTEILEIMFPALLFDLNTKANTYNLYGNFKYNAINTVEDYNGFTVGLEKTSMVRFRENMFLKL
jgi:hypothetical protein